MKDAIVNQQNEESSCEGTLSQVSAEQDATRCSEDADDFSPSATPIEYHYVAQPVPIRPSTIRIPVDVQPGLSTTAEPRKHIIAGFRNSDENISVDPEGITENVQGEDPDLYNDPSSEEVDSHGEKVMKKLNKAYTAFSRANGLFIVFSNKNGINARVIDKVHNTSDKLCQAFQKLGFAHCQFKDCNKAEIMAAYKELAEMDLKGYKSVIIYHVCHGKNSYINVQDGFLSIQVLKAMLSEENSRLLKGKAKVVVFDCCRRGILLQNQTYDDMLVVYTTSLGERSFIFTASGMTFASNALIELVEREEHCSLSDLFLVDLKIAVSEASVLKDGTDLKLRVNCEGGLGRKIFLHTDKLQKMAPTRVTLEEDDATNMCTVQWRKPAHADHHNLHCYSLVCEQDNSYQTIVSGISSSDTQLQVPGKNVSGKTLTIVAIYLDNKVPATKFDPSCWCPVKGTYSEASEASEASEVSDASEALETSDTNQCRVKDCIKKYRCYLILGLLFGGIILQGIGYGIFYACIHHNIHEFNILAVNGNVIDCDKLSSPQKFFLSSMSLTQVVTDERNDNHKGLSIKVKSFERSEILEARRTYSYVGSKYITLNKNFNRFLIPNDYYAYPLYVWAGSNLTVQVNWTSCNISPEDLTMYIVLGDQNYYSFSNYPSTIPQHEYKIDLRGHYRKTYLRTLQNNGYYYIVVTVKTECDFNFSAAVKFEYYSVSSKDLNFTKATSLFKTDSTVSISLDTLNRKIVVCSVDFVPDREAYMIHLHLKYFINWIIVGTFPLCVCVIFVIFVITTVIVYCAAKKLQSLKHGQYQEIR